MSNMMKLAQARNAKMFEQYQQGAGVSTLARDFDVTTQRIYQIVSREAKTSGVPLRAPLPRRGGGRRRNVLPQWVVDLIAQRQISIKDAAEIMGWSHLTVRRQLKQDDRPHNLCRKRNAEIYAKFMAGCTLKELAEEYNKTVPLINQILIRHRKKHNLPRKSRVKKQWVSPTEEQTCYNNADDAPLA